MASIEEPVRNLLQGKNFANVATLRQDGSVHGVVVWVDVDGDSVVLNTAQGRAWERNVARDPRVTMTVPDQSNPYEFVEIRGTVTDVTTDGADDHIDAMAKKYIGQDEYPFRQPGEVRVKVTVAPDKINHRAQ